MDNEDKTNLIDQLKSRIESLEQQLSEVLQSSDLDLDAVAKDISDFVMVTDLDYNIISINRIAEQFEEHEIIGASIFDFMAEDYRRSVKKALDDAVKTGQPKVYDVFGAGEKGPDTAWYSTKAIPFKVNGEVTKIIHICRDITAQVESEKALHDSLESSHALMNATTESMLLLNPDGVVLSINEAGARRFGKKPKEIIGNKLTDPETSILPPDVIKNRKKYHDKVIKTGMPTTFEDTRDGIIFETHMYPVIDKKKNVSGIVVYGKDITERKLAEKALRDSEERFRELADLLPQSIFELDATGKFTYVNKFAIESFGHTEEDFKKGISALDFIESADKNRAAERMNRLFSGEKLYGAEYTAIRKDGTKFPVAVYSSSVVKGDDVVGIRGIVIDISDRKQYENRLRESQERYKLLVENVRASIAIFNTKGEIFYANKIAAQALNTAPETMIGKTMWYYFPKEIADGQMETIANVIKTGEESSTLTKTMVAERWRWYHTVIQAIKPNGDNPAMALVIATDITETKENEIRNNARLRLFDRIKDANNTGDILSFGCMAINEFGLFNKGAIFLIDDSEDIIYQAEFGYGNKEFGRLRKLFPEFTSVLHKMRWDKKSTRNICAVSIGKDEKVELVNALSANDNNTGLQNHFDHILFKMDVGDGSRQKALVLATNPTDGRLPNKNDAEYLQEIAEIVVKDIRRVERVTQLAKERVALKEANIALGQVLEHIEKEKLQIRQEIARQIEQSLIPAFNKILMPDGSINMAFYNVLRNGMEEIIVHSGGVTQLLSRLSTRELEICNLLKSGSSSAEIAEALYISIGTVKKHREKIREKLGIKGTSKNLREFLRKA